MYSMPFIILLKSLDASSYMYSYSTYLLTCTRFQLCEISATGSVDTEQSAPISMICGVSNDDVKT